MLLRSLSQGQQVAIMRLLSPRASASPWEERARELSNIVDRLQKDRVPPGQGNRHKPRPGTPDTTARESIDRTSLCSSPFFSAARGVSMRPRWPGEISS